MGSRFPYAGLSLVIQEHLPGLSFEGLADDDICIILKLLYFELYTQVIEPEGRLPNDNIHYGKSARSKHNNPHGKHRREKKLFCETTKEVNRKRNWVERRARIRRVGMEKNAKRKNKERRSNERKNVWKKKEEETKSYTSGIKTIVKHTNSNNDNNNNNVFKQTQNNNNVVISTQPSSVS